MFEVKIQAYPSDGEFCFGFSVKTASACVFVYSQHLVIIFRELQMTQRWTALRLIDWRHTPIPLLTATVNPLKMGSDVIERHSGSTHQHTMSRAPNGPALIWSTCFSCSRHTQLRGTTSEQQSFTLGFFSGVCVCLSPYILHVSSWVFTIAWGLCIRTQSVALASRCNLLTV